MEDSEHVGVCQRRVPPPAAWSSAPASSLLAGGEAQGRLPTRHWLCAGVRLHGVGPLGGHTERRLPPDPSPGQKLHDNAAEGRGFPASQQHHASGEFPPSEAQTLGTSGPNL